MEEKTLKKIFMICAAVGIGTTALLLIPHLIFGEITGYDVQISMINTCILFMGLFARVSYSRFKPISKNAVKFGIVIVVAILLVMVAYRINEENEKKEWIKKLEYYAKVDLEYWIYQMEMEDAAIDLYNNNFTKDEEIMSAFYTIRVIHPFLTEQMLVLRNRMRVLVNNVTMDNYIDARDQYLLCMEMNIPYSDFISTILNGG